MPCCHATCFLVRVEKVQGPEKEYIWCPRGLKWVKKVFVSVRLTVSLKRFDGHADLGWGISEPGRNLVRRQKVKVSCSLFV